MPVTVTLNIPEVKPVTVRMDGVDPPASSVTFTGFSDGVRPVEGETVAESWMVPANPPRLVKVIVELPEAPALMVNDVGLAAMLKSPTLTVTETELDFPPPLPVTVTV